MHYSNDDIIKLQGGYSRICDEYEFLLSKFMNFQFKNEEAKEFALQGFMRRMKTLKRCIENIYMICPLKQENKLSFDELTDLEINLQAFLFNLFGCIDCLAWVWVKEKQLKNKKGELLYGVQVGLMSKDKNKIVRETFSEDFQTYLDGKSTWNGYLENYRHALAHRIPLYVPPYRINPHEEEKYNRLETEKFVALRQHDVERIERLDSELDDLEHFIPWMTHSYSEKTRPIKFHVQVLTDWMTIVEISQKFFDELNFLPDARLRGHDGVGM